MNPPENIDTSLGLGFRDLNAEYRDEAQSRAVAVIAVNAMANLPMKPAPAMLERAMAPSDEEFEEDPEGCIAIWGGIVERAHATYRARHKRSMT